MVQKWKFWGSKCIVGPVKIFFGVVLQVNILLWYVSKQELLKKLGGPPKSDYSLSLYGARVGRPKESFLAILGALAGLFCQVIASLIHVGWSFSALELATKYVRLPWFFPPATFSLNGARRSRLKESFWRKYRAIQGRIGAVENLPTPSKFIEGPWGLR